MIRGSRLLLAAAAALLLAHPAGAQNFGNAAVVTENEAIVGEPTHELRPGLVWVFSRAEDGSWVERQRLEASDGFPGDRFGIRLAVQGDELFVSATRATDNLGAVYVFRRSEDGWVETQKLAPAALEPMDRLGSGLAVDGDWLAVASISHGEDAGAVWTYRRDGDRWVEHSRVPVASQAGEQAGSELALTGGQLLVAIPSRGDNKGAVLAYRYDAESDGWVEGGALPTMGLTAGAAFGSSLSARDGVALVGAPNFLNRTGMVYTYTLGEDGWTPGSMLAPFEAFPQGRFGMEVNFNGSEAWIAAPMAGGFAGRVYSYAWDAEVGEWSRAAKLPTPQGLSSGDLLGLTAALGRDLGVAVAFGADYGAGVGYVFEKDMGSWTGGAPVVSEMMGAEAILGEEVRCSEEGEAGMFECQEVDLVSFLPVADMGADRGVVTNDVWGWTDPRDGREIAIVGMTNQTAFVDVTNPSNPRFLGRLPMTEGAQGSTWRDMKVYNDHVFIVSDNAGPHGMQVFDLTRLRGLDGTEPQRFDEDAVYAEINSAHNVVINEETGFAYIVGAGQGGETCGGGLHMVDIRDPRNPTFAGCFQDTTTGRQRTGYSHDAQCIVYHGPDEDYTGAEICFGSNETALSIADVSDKENPVAVAMASYPNVGYSHQGWVDEDHEYFYMNDELDEVGGQVEGTRTLVWDIRDLDDPILVKEYISENRSSDHNLYTLGDIMYQSNYVSGLRVLDISDRENPTPVGYFDTVPYGEDEPGFNGSWSNYPYFRSGIVIVTSGSEGLFVVRYRGNTPVSE